MTKTLADLQVGESIFFLEHEPKPYTIKAKGGKYLIATVEDGDYKRYTIIDTENGYCGPNDRIFNPYDYTKQEDIDQCLDDLLTGNYGLEISQRHRAEIKNVIDLEKTLN